MEAADEGPVHATAAVQDGVIYIAGCDEQFRAVRVADGKVLFELPLGGYTGASPAVDGDRAYRRHLQRRRRCVRPPRRGRSRGAIAIPSASFPTTRRPRCSSARRHDRGRRRPRQGDSRDRRGNAGKPRGSSSHAHASIRRPPSPAAGSTSDRATASSTCSTARPEEAVGIRRRRRDHRIAGHGGRTRRRRRAGRTGLLLRIGPLAACCLHYSMRVGPHPHARHALRATPFGLAAAPRRPPTSDLRPVADIVELDVHRDPSHGADRSTEVGSYFVATYPPFSVWSAEAVERDAMPALHRRPIPRVAAGALPSHPVLPEAVPLLLLPRLHRQERAGGRAVISTCSRASGSCTREQPAIAGRPLNFVYFGGGTPSFLSTQQLQGLGQRGSPRSRRGPTPKKSRSSASPAR